MFQDKKLLKEVFVSSFVRYLDWNIFCVPAIQAILSTDWLYIQQQLHVFNSYYKATCSSKMYSEGTNQVKITLS